MPDTSWLVGLTECVGYPVDVVLAPLKINANHVESAMVMMGAGVAQQEKIGCIDQLSLLAAGDAGSRVSKSALATVAHLNKYQLLFACHDQINFTHLAPEIACDQG